MLNFRLKNTDKFSESQLSNFLVNAVPIVLFITHNRGGGVDKHIKELIGSLPDGIASLILKPSSNGSRCVVVESANKPFLFFDYQKDIGLLEDFFKQINLVHLHIHHTKGFSSAVLDIVTNLGLSWDYTVHDYYSICPQIHLIDNLGRYCQERGDEECAACLLDNPSPNHASILEWRQQNRYLVEKAKRCFVPSLDVKLRMERYYPKANYITVYHEKIKSYKTNFRATTQNLQILILGALTPMKGANLLEAAAIDAKIRGLPLNFVLIGDGSHKLVSQPKSQLQVMGRYCDDELQRLIEQSQADVIWFPVCCPETYSYTLSAALIAGLPIVAPNLGAFSERLRQRPLSWIVPWDLQAEKFNDFFVSLHRRLQQGKGQVFDEQYGNLLNAEVLSFATQFRYESDYIELDKVENKSDCSRADQLYDLLKTKIKPPFNLTAMIKYNFLTIISQLRCTTLFSRLVRSIPQSFQTRLKGWLLGESKR